MGPEHAKWFFRTLSTSEMTPWMKRFMPETAAVLPEIAADLEKMIDPLTKLSQATLDDYNNMDPRYRVETERYINYLRNYKSTPASPEPATIPTNTRYIPAFYPYYG